MRREDLRPRRLNMGLTIKAAAAKIGVPPHVLRYAEHGGTPRPESARLIAAFYGCERNEIWPPEQETEAA
jgi:lambda repressor-like predicted transcriptional regulator